MPWCLALWQGPQTTTLYGQCSRRVPCHQTGQHILATRWRHRPQTGNNFGPHWCHHLSTAAWTRMQSTFSRAWPHPGQTPMATSPPHSRLPSDVWTALAFPENSLCIDCKLCCVSLCRSAGSALDQPRLPGFSSRSPRSRNHVPP